MGERRMYFPSSPRINSHVPQQISHGSPLAVRQSPIRPVGVRTSQIPIAHYNPVTFQRSVHFNTQQSPSLPPLANPLASIRSTPTNGDHFQSPPWPRVNSSIHQPLHPVSTETRQSIPSVQYVPSYSRPPHPPLSPTPAYGSRSNVLAEQPCKHPRVALQWVMEKNEPPPALQSQPRTVTVNSDEKEAFLKEADDLKRLLAEQKTEMDELKRLFLARKVRKKKIPKHLTEEGGSDSFSAVYIDRRCESERGFDDFKKNARISRGGSVFPRVAASEDENHRRANPSLLSPRLQMDSVSPYISQVNSEINCDRMGAFHPISEATELMSGRIQVAVSRVENCDSVLSVLENHGNSSDFNSSELASGTNGGDRGRGNVLPNLYVDCRIVSVPPFPDDEAFDPDRQMLCEKSSPGSPRRKMSRRDARNIHCQKTHIEYKQSSPIFKSALKLEAVKLNPLTHHLLLTVVEVIFADDYRSLGREAGNEENESSSGTSLFVPRGQVSISLGRLVDAFECGELPGKFKLQVPVYWGPSKLRAQGFNNHWELNAGIPNKNMRAATKLRGDNRGTLVARVRFVPFEKQKKGMEITVDAAAKLIAARMQENISKQVKPVSEIHDDLKKRRGFGKQTKSEFAFMRDVSVDTSDLFRHTGTWVGGKQHPNSYWEGVHHFHCLKCGCTPGGLSNVCRAADPATTSCEICSPSKASFSPSPVGSRARVDLERIHESPTSQQGSFVVSSSSMVSPPPMLPIDPAPNSPPMMKVQASLTSELGNINGSVDGECEDSGSDQRESLNDLSSRREQISVSQTSHTSDNIRSLGPTGGRRLADKLSSFGSGQGSNIPSTQPANSLRPSSDSHWNRIMAEAVDTKQTISPTVPFSVAHVIQFRKLAVRNLPFADGLMKCDPFLRLFLAKNMPLAHIKQAENIVQGCFIRTDTRRGESNPDWSDDKYKFELPKLELNRLEVKSAGDFALVVEVLDHSDWNLPTSYGIFSMTLKGLTSQGILKGVKQFALKKFDPMLDDEESRLAQISSSSSSSSGKPRGTDPAQESPTLLLQLSIT